MLYYNWNTSSGIDDNETMKVRGQGGADVERNKPGDLFLTIKVTFSLVKFWVLYVSSIGILQVNYGSFVVVALFNLVSQKNI